MQPHFKNEAKEHLAKKDHAPDTEKLDSMHIIARIVEKKMKQLGKFIPSQENKTYDDLPVLGPYKHDEGSYTGQYMNGMRHGYGTFVRIFVVGGVF